MTFCWLVMKDVVLELRACRSLPVMLLLGFVLVFLLETQIDLGPHDKAQVVAGLLWIDVIFAGAFLLDRSVGAEQDQGCWQALLLYPVSPTLIFLAKTTVAALGLSLLECVLVPAFMVFSTVELLRHPLWFALVALLANFGYASIGVVTSAATAKMTGGSGLLSVVLLPLASPVVLAAAAATRCLVVEDFGDSWWRWLQLLGCFALVFGTLGSVLFEVVIEE
jgi:heme exporter protein B